jgi:hypothetical protein
MDGTWHPGKRCRASGWIRAAGKGPTEITMYLQTDIGQVSCIPPTRFFVTNAEGKTYHNLKKIKYTFYQARTNSSPV